MGILNLFIGLHLLILVAAFFSFILRMANDRKIISLKAKEELHLNYILLVLAMALPLATTFFSDNYKFEPMAKTYSAATYMDYDARLKTAPQEKIIFAAAEKQAVLPVDALKNFFLAVLFFSLLFSLLKILRQSVIMGKMLKKSFLLKSSGKLRIAFSDQIKVPFSLLTLRHAWVLLPSSFMHQSGKARISIYHEFQHHRQGDTKWVYLLQLLKALAGVNPAIHLWINIISELQELKVDENLIGKGKVGPGDYARCLIEVAESVALGEKQLVCAASLAFLPKRHLLTRRIEFMFRKNASNRMAFRFMALFLLSSMVTFAFGTANLVGSRTMTKAALEKLAASMGEESPFLIVVNDQVLEQLNRFIGTTQGREAMRKALLRMETYRFMIEGKFKAYDLPMEFMAVPIIESAYQNLPSSRNPLFAAGLWQFIRSTAKNYGLKVDKTKDERLHPEKSTDAAVRYLLANQLRFKNWHLAALAYNMGESSVQRAINEVGSRDAWKLIRAGHEGDKNYLPKLMAAVLIMKNPSLVD